MLAICGVDKEVIHFDPTAALWNVNQYPLHQMFEDGGGVTEPEGHRLELPQPLSDGEGSLWAGLL